MINTYEQAALRQSAERLVASEWSEATKAVEAMTNDELFKESVVHLKANPNDPSTPEYAKALAGYAVDYCKIYGDGFSDKTEDEIILLAGAPNFFHLQNRIDDLEKEKRQQSNRRLDKPQWEEYKQLKKELVGYNQLLSDFIYNNPDGTMSDLNQALTEQAITSFPKHAEQLFSTITQETRGARTEAASRRLLDIAHVPYERGTVYEDTRGGDIIIIFNNKRIKVDIKSSLDQIAKINDGYDDTYEHKKAYAISKSPRGRKTADDVIAIFPGFTDRDFGDSLNLQLDSATLQERSNMLAAQLMRAIRELNV